MLNCRISLIVYPCCNKILAPDKPDKGLTVADSPHSSANITQPRVSALIFSSPVFHSYLIKKKVYSFLSKKQTKSLYVSYYYIFCNYFTTWQKLKTSSQKFQQKFYIYFVHLFFAKIKQKLICQHLSNPFQIRFGFLKKKS